MCTYLQSLRSEINYDRGEPYRDVAQIGDAIFALFKN